MESQANNKKWVLGGAIAAAVLAVGGIAYVISQQARTAKEFCVGVILPQTGDASYIGQSIKNGMTIAQDNYLAKAKDAQPFELRVEYADNGSNPSNVVTGYQSLVNIKNCQAIVAVQQGVKSLIPLVEQDKRVLLATSVPDNDIAGANPWTFRFFLSAKTDAEAIAKYAVEKLKVKTVGIIYVNDSTGLSYKDSITNSFTQLGAKVVIAESFGLGDTDYRTQVLKIKQANPDAVYIMGYGKSMANIPIQLREAGVKSTILAVGTLSQPEILQAAGKAAEGAFYTTTQFFTFDPKTPELKQFVADYKAKFGQVPVFFEVFGYDSLNLLLMAAEKGGTDPEKLRSALTQIKDVPMAVGTVTVPSDQDIQFPVVVRTIKNGQWADAP